MSLINPVLYLTMPRQRRKQWHPTPVLLPGKSHGQRSLVGYSPWGRYESDTTEQLHFSLSCIGKGSGNLLQYSFLENPMDRGAWCVTVHGVAKRRTQLNKHTKKQRHYFASKGPSSQSFGFSSIYVWM